MRYSLLGIVNIQFFCHSIVQMVIYVRYTNVCGFGRSEGPIENFVLKTRLTTHKKYI